MSAKSKDKTTTKLAKLKLGEISGVDAAANDTRGWILAKAEAFKQDVEEVEKSVVGTFEGLTSDGLDQYLAGAPEDVLKARKVLAEHIAKDITESEEDDTVAKSTESPVAQRITDLFKSESEPDETAEAETTDETAEDETPADEQDAETSEEAGTEDEGDKPEDEGTGGEETSEEDDTTATDEEPADEADATDEADAIAKAVVDAIPAIVRDEVRKALESRDEDLQKAAETHNEVLDAALDRLENVEKHLAGQSGLDGQDMPGGDEAEGEQSSLGKAVASAVRNGRVELT